jgi:hypothetical protein
MSSSTLSRPEPGEYEAYYGAYISLVPAGDLAGLLATQMEETGALLAGLSEQQGEHRYAPGKWSIKEVVGHVTDSERVFSYRMLRFARGDSTPLPGFDQDTWMPNSRFGERALKTLAADLRTVRQATLALIRSLPPEAAARGGEANGEHVTVRALAYIIAGHERHHVGILRDRYS